MYETAVDIAVEANGALADRSVGPALMLLGDAASARALAPVSTTWIDNYALIQLKSKGLHGPEVHAFVARAIERAPPGSIWSGNLRTEYADLLRTEGRYADALEFVEAARTFYPSESTKDAPEDDLRLLATHLGVAGECWLGLGLPDVAAPFFEREGALAKRLGDRWAAQAFHDHRMKTAQALADYERLSLCIEAALADPLLASASATYRAKLAVRRLLARLELERAGAPRGAAATMYAELCANADLDDYDRREAHMHGAMLYADEGQDSACLAALARLRASTLHDRATPTGETLEYEACARAFELEIAARSSPELISERATRLRAVFESFLDWWNASPERIGGVGFLATGRRRYVVDATLRGELLRSPGQAGLRRAFDVLIEVQAAGSLTQALGAQPPTLESAVAALCPPNAAVLCYLPGRRRSHLFVVSNSELQRFDLPPSETIEVARRELELRTTAALRALAKWNDSQLAPSLAQASDALLPDAARACVSQFDSLIVIGLDSIGYVPMETLLDSEGRPLGARRAVAYAPSAAAAVLLAQRAPTVANASSLGFGRILAPAMASECVAPFGLASFVTPHDALSEVVSAWRGAFELFEGRAATRQALEATSGPVLHLVTHGYFDPTRELQAAVLLAGANGAACEPWWSEDAARLRAPSIVVLTACGAGRGPRRRGDDGRASFAGQFLTAGADAVVLSQVELELSLAMQHSVELHRALARGEPVASALVAARRALGDDPSELPLQHFLVHVVGNGEARAPVDGARALDPPRGQPQRSARLPYAALAAVAVVIGALAALLSRRRSAAGSGESDGSRDAR